MGTSNELQAKDERTEHRNARLLLTSGPALRFACAQQWPAGSRKAQEGRQVCCEQIVDLFYDAAATSSSSAAANAGANGVSGTGEPSSSTAGLPAQDTLEDLLVG